MCRKSSQSISKLSDLWAMGPPEELVASFRWAKCCVDYLDQQGELGWLKSMETLPISTWFSGYGCAETAFQMLESALKGKRETDGKSFSSSYQFEIAVKARQACLDRIDAHTCQHIDILRRLRDVDRIELEKIEQASSNPSEDLWEFLLKKQFLSEGLCSRHKNRPGTYIYIYTGLSHGPQMMFSIEISS